MFGVLRILFELAGNFALFGLWLVALLVARVIGLAWLAWLFVLLRRRARLARYIGLATIALIGFPIPLVLLKTPTDHAARAFGWLSVVAVVFAVFVYWAYAFAFSAKARHYFGREGELVHERA